VLAWKTKYGTFNKVDKHENTNTWYILLKSGSQSIRNPYMLPCTKHLVLDGIYRLPVELEV